MRPDQQGLCDRGGGDDRHADEQESDAAVDYDADERPLRRYAEIVGAHTTGNVATNSGRHHLLEKYGFESGG